MISSTAGSSISGSSGPEPHRAGQQALDQRLALWLVERARLLAQQLGDAPPQRLRIRAQLRRTVARVVDQPPPQPLGEILDRAHRPSAAADTDVGPSRRRSPGAPRHDAHFTREVLRRDQRRRLSQRRAHRGGRVRAFVCAVAASASRESRRAGSAAAPGTCAARPLSPSVVTSTSTSAPGRSASPIVRAPVTATSTRRPPCSRRFVRGGAAAVPSCAAPT